MLPFMRGHKLKWHVFVPNVWHTVCPLTTTRTALRCLCRCVAPIKMARSWAFFPDKSNVNYRGLVSKHFSESFHCEVPVIRFNREPLSRNCKYTHSDWQTLEKFYNFNSVSYVQRARFNLRFISEKKYEKMLFLLLRAILERNQTNLRLLLLLRQ